MSTIPEGLRADYMRERMEDKATITAIGGLYIGGPTATYYHNNDGTMTPECHETIVLAPAPNSTGLPLVSNGPNAVPSYQQLGSIGIAPEAVTKAKLGNGTVASADGNHKYVLDITKDSNNIVTIHYYIE